MSFRRSVCLVLFVLLLSHATLALGTQDPELEQCKHQCRAQRQYDEKKVKACLQKCEDYVRDETDLNRKSPIERLRDCSRSCEQQQHGEQREVCQRRCQEEYQKEEEEWREREWEREHGGESGRDGIMSRKEREGKEEEEEEGQNPYVFEDRHFITGMQTEHGRVRILQKFTERSKLLRELPGHHSRSKPSNLRRA
ncbi:hypothetical protein OROGR_027430 [Orobanche gracilis]